MHHCFICVGEVCWKDRCLEAKACMTLCADLPAVDAVYHTNCHHEFLNELQCFKVRERYVKHNWFGTQSSRTSEEDPWCFLRTCEWFEDSEDGLYTLGELQQYLKDISEVEDNMYRTRWIKSKIIERYGKEHVIFTEICGWRDVVCFCKMTNYIINYKSYTDKQSGIEEESFHIVKRALR